MSFLHSSTTTNNSVSQCLFLFADRCEKFSRSRIGLKQNLYDRPINLLIQSRSKVKEESRSRLDSRLERENLDLENLDF